MNIVFLGPSLPVERARELAPVGTHFLPPVAQGDIASICRVKPPTAIGIVDGLFRKTLSVWHKEILFALDRGARVFGASSMGALRAVECEPWGAEPIGLIADWVKLGTVSDADVALAHAGAEHGFRALSLPMVNVIATVAACPEIEIGRRGEILAAARGIFYAERKWPDIWKAAACTREERMALAAHGVDQKARDAEELLREMGQGTTRTEKSARLVPKNIFEGYGAVLQGNDVRVPCQDKKVRRAYEIAHSNLWCINQATDRQLAVECARMLGLEEKARAEAKLMMETLEFVEQMRAEFDLLPHELERLLTDQRMLSYARAWVESIDMSFGNAPRILSYLRASQIYSLAKTGEIQPAATPQP